MAAADSWYNLLIARFALGFAVGAKSSTTPVYAAESAPKNIRGALTMSKSDTNSSMMIYIRCVLADSLPSVANVDGFRYHVGLRRLSCFPGYRLPRAVLAMAVDVGVDIDTAIHSDVHGLLLSRIAAMVSCATVIQNGFELMICRYMEKGKFDKAFNSLRRLRGHDIQAARDMYYAYKLLEVEAAERAGKSLFKEFFLVKRNRRAAQSSFFVMFMQQFCGQ